MFDYPLSIPQNTLYSMIGVDPEATTEEIREATEEFTIAVKRQKEEADKKIEGVFKAVAGLKETYQQIKALQGQDQEASLDDLRSAQRKLIGLEQKAEAVSPGFKQLKERSAELELKIHEINRMGLQNPETRLSHDKANPPIELLKLAECAQDQFTNNKVALVLLRRELSEFLKLEGEEVFHPSDLTREDFYSDFDFNPLLDGSRQ
jgi:hypothetical protein